MDFEDFMIDVEQCLEELAGESGSEFSSAEMESMMYHLFENGEDYRHQTADVVALRLLNEYLEDRVQLA